MQTISLASTVISDSTDEAVKFNDAADPLHELVDSYLLSATAVHTFLATH